MESHVPQRQRDVGHPTGAAVVYCGCDWESYLLWLVGIYFRSAAFFYAHSVRR